MNQRTTRSVPASVHSHPFSGLLWNERGVASVTVGPRTWTMTPSVGLWLPAGVEYLSATSESNGVRPFLFSAGDSPGFADDATAVEVDALPALLLTRLGSEDLGEASRALTEKMVIDVLRPASRELVLRVPVSALLQPIVEEVRGARDYEQTLGDWADRLGVSSRTITRAFHAEASVGFSRWSATVRAQHAIELLADGRQVDDVAEAVGFRSSSAFGASFRSITGTTPGRFQSL